VSDYELAQIILGSGMLLVTGAAVGVAYCQLKAANKQLEGIATASKQTARANQISNVMAVIQLESSIAEARYHYTEALARFATLGDTPDPKALDFAKAIKAAAEEQYLNTVDRLCTCIIRRQVDEEVYRRDYRKLICTDLVKDFKEYLGVGTRYPNIVAVQQAWDNDKSAVDPTIKPPE